MRSRISFITIPVADLKKSLEFYRDGLGFPTQGIQQGNEDHVLFELENGMGLVLYVRSEFLKFTNYPDQATGSAGFIISHFAESKQEVDKILESAIKAGAQPVGEPKNEPWGYSANFTDLDGHQWEIIWNQDYH